MRTFLYTAVDNEGNAESGFLEAIDEKQAAEFLRGRGLLVTSIEVKREFNPFRTISKLRGVPLSEKVIFTRQLSTMLGSGIHITQSLEILQRQSKNRMLAAALQDIGRQVDGGASLHQALSSHPEVFDKLYLSLVKAGEASGNLDEILSRLADTLFAESQFKSKVKGAMIYPALITLVMLGVLVIMLVFVIPKLSTLYDEMGAELPITTKLLLSVSSNLVRFWWVVLIVIVILTVVFKKFSETLKGKYTIADTQFNLPVFGQLGKETQLGSFTRTLGMLVGSGIPILEALEISKDTVSNMRFKEGITNAALAVEKGKSLADYFMRDRVFPSILPEMISVGEQTGKLEEVLEKLSDYFEAEATNTLENLASAMEPIIMIGLGTVVGFLVISLILPIYSLTAKF